MTLAVDWDLKPQTKQNKLILSKQAIGENFIFDPFSMYILALKGNNSCLKK